MSTSPLPVRSILRHYRAATEQAIEAGTHWYEAALVICRQAAVEHDLDLERTVCALAHLSSRLAWTKNVEAFALLVAGQPHPARRDGQGTAVGAVSRGQGARAAGQAVPQ